MKKFLAISLILSSCDISEEVQNNVDVCKVINPDWIEQVIHYLIPNDG